MNKFNGHYTEWNKKRVAFIFKQLGKKNIDDKTILILGDGEGDIANKFAAAGGIVTVIEGRMSNINAGRLKYPNVAFIEADLNLCNITKKYDIVISMGLLYHLHSWHQSIHIQQICDIGSVTILETEVLDIEAMLVMDTVDPVSFDQALDTYSGCPSEGYVESTILSTGKKFIRYDKKELNSSFHTYDWKNEFSGVRVQGKRRFYIIT
jgi:hypothetical protein